MTKKLLVRGFEKKPNRTLGFGDVFLYYALCYLKGKELGCEEVYIIRPICGMAKIMGYNEPSDRLTRYLPVNILPINTNINESIYDEIIDISQPDTLFPGFRGMDIHFWETQLYLNYYYYNIDKNIYLDIDRDDIENKYILIQYRNAGRIYPPQNTNNEEFIKLFNLLKEILGNKYKFIRVGDKSPIDDKFDEFITPNWDVDSFAKLVRNCSLLVSCHSGVQEFASLFKDVPIIVFGAYGPESLSSKEKFKRICGDRYGEVLLPWAHEKSLEFNRGQIDKGRVESYLKAWNI